MSTDFLKGANKAILSSVIDALIPSFEAMPSASEAEVVSHWANEVLNIRHDLRESLFRALRVLDKLESNEAKEKLNALQKQDPEAFNALGVVVAGGYFLNPDIREKIGYPGQICRDDYEAEEEMGYVSDGLLAPVLSRGTLYRVPHNPTNP